MDNTQSNASTNNTITSNSGKMNNSAKNSPNTRRNDNQNRSNNNSTNTQKQRNAKGLPKTNNTLPDNSYSTQRNNNSNNNNSNLLSDEAGKDRNEVDSGRRGVLITKGMTILLIFWFCFKSYFDILDSFLKFRFLSYRKDRKITCRTNNPFVKMIQLNSIVLQLFLFLQPNQLCNLLMLLSQLASYQNESLVCLSYFAKFISISLFLPPCLSSDALSG